MEQKNMKSIIVSMVAVAGLMIAGSTLAAEMPEIAKKNGCVACHKIDAKLVGPSWMDISNKYKGDAAAADMLLAKVSKGGKGTWGTMPMPAQDPTGAKQADMKELVSFIMGLAK